MVSNADSPNGCEMFKLDGHITKGGYRNDAVMDWFAGVTENPLVDQATRESCPRRDDTDLAKSAPALLRHAEHY